MNRETMMAKTASTAPLTRPYDSTRQRGDRLVAGLLRGSVLVAAVGIATISSPGSLLGDTPCDAYVRSCGDGLCDCGLSGCDAAPTCGCGKCGSSKSFKNNPLFKSLDMVAGGIEKVLGLDRCQAGSCGKMACDAGCDSYGGMAQLDPNASMTILPHIIHVPTPIPEVPAPAMPLAKPRVMMPQLPTIPPLEMTPPEAAPPLPELTAPPETPPMPKLSKPRIVSPDAPPIPREAVPRDLTPPQARMTEPRIVPASPERSLPAGPDASPPMQLPELENDPTDIFGGDTPSAVPPVLPTKPKVDPAPKKEGSIFDALDDLDDLEDLNDPFKEDAARLRQPYVPIRPAGMRSSGVQIPPYRSVYPLRNLKQEAVSPASHAVGSGLRAARTVEPLRPVSHEEPVDLSPMSGHRVLAPYRASR